MVKRLRPNRSSSAAPLSPPPAPVFGQKPETLARAKKNALKDKKFLKAIHSVEADADRPTKRDELPNFDLMPLATPEGVVNPMVAERLFNKGREYLIREADQHGVARDYFVQKLLRSDRPDRSRSLSARGAPSQPIDPKLARLSPFNERGRGRRVSEAKKKAATRQFIDGKPKHLQPRE